MPSARCRVQSAVLGAGCEVPRAVHGAVRSAGCWLLAACQVPDSAQHPARGTLHPAPHPAAGTLHPALFLLPLNRPGRFRA